jgi:hypothetical protein
LKEYDIVISFAGEDRQVAEEIAVELKNNGIRVFYDNFEKADLWGKDLYEHLIDVYKNKSKYCLMILSKYYEKKLWTNHERKAAQARAFRESAEYILPLKLDDSEISTVLETVGYLDYRQESTLSVVDLILKKLWGDLNGDENILILQEKLERVYQSTMATCDFSLMPSNHMLIEHKNIVFEYLENAIDYDKDLKVHLQINSSKINNLVLSKVTKYIDCIEVILNKANFLINLRNKKYANYDFVSEFPEFEMNYCYDLLKKLSICGGTDAQKLYLPSKILKQWLVAEKECERFCSNPEKYILRKGYQPFVYNKRTMQKLNPKSLKEGLTVHVFDLRN